MEYITNDFVEQHFPGDRDFNCEIVWQPHTYESSGQRLSQGEPLQLILKPLVNQLFITFGKEQSGQKLKNMLANIHKSRTQNLPYAAGNLLNLLIQLGCNVRGYDFSALKVWQAYLRGVATARSEFCLCRSVTVDLHRYLWWSYCGSVQPSGRPPYRQQLPIAVYGRGARLMGCRASFMKDMGIGSEQLPIALMGRCWLVALTIKLYDCGMFIPAKASRYWQNIAAGSIQ